MLLFLSGDGDQNEEEATEKVSDGKDERNGKELVQMEPARSICEKSGSYSVYVVSSQTCLLASKSSDSGKGRKHSLFPPKAYYHLSL